MNEKRKDREMVKEIKSREYVVEVADEDFRKREAKSYRSFKKIIKNHNTDKFLANVEKAIREKESSNTYDN